MTLFQLEGDKVTLAILHKHFCPKSEPFLLCVNISGPNLYNYYHSNKSAPQVVHADITSHAAPS